MKAFDFGFEGRKLLFDCFDKDELFACGLDFALPAVDGLNRAQNDGGASGEAFADYFAGDAAGFDEVPAGDQHDAGGLRSRHDFLPNEART